jgi:hypothetical protein
MESSRKRLLSTIGIALAMLPRYLRHDLWRITEPQHTNAVNKIAETLTAKIEDQFELQEKPTRAPFSLAYLYKGRKEDGGE